MSRWSVYVVCRCGWWDEPTAGSAWFTRQHYPVCPRCGRSTSEATTVTAKVVGVLRRRLEIAGEDA